MNINSFFPSSLPFSFLTGKTNNFIGEKTPNSLLSEQGINPPASSQDLSANLIVRGIEKTIGADKMPASPYDKQITQKNLADKILAFASHAYGQLQNDKPGFDRAGFFKQMKQDVDTAFTNANASGFNNPQLENDLNTAYAKIQEDLTKLETDSRTPAAPVARLQAFSAQINQSAEIEVTTKEGDTIKIRLAHSAASSENAVVINGDGFSAAAWQNSSESNSEFSVTIEGNLNEDEQNSLTALLKQMGKVQQTFFNGDIQAAFSHAQKIGLDTAQLAGFSMNLSMERSVQAITAYQQTAFPEQPIEPDKIKQAADYFYQSRELLQSAQSALQPFEDPFSVFNAFFDAVNQTRTENGGVTNAKDSLPLLQQITAQLGGTILDSNKPTKAATL